MDRIEVLDHGFVRLVDSMGDDLSVVRAARVSYDAAWRAGDDQGSDARLINYLWKNAHTSPFEAVTFTFEVKAPIFVFRQWHRHRTWSFNELSARYRELPEETYLPDFDHIAKQSTNNKQGREAESSFSRDEKHKIRDLICDANSLAFARYRDMLEMGVARELARSGEHLQPHVRDGGSDESAEIPDAQDAFSRSIRNQGLCRRNVRIGAERGSCVDRSMGTGAARMSASYTAEQKLEAINRELGFRRRVYARRVAEKAMSQKQSDEQIGIFKAIRDDYEKLAAGERLI